MIDLRRRRYIFCHTEQAAYIWPVMCSARGQIPIHSTTNQRRKYVMISYSPYMQNIQHADWLEADIAESGN